MIVFCEECGARNSVEPFETSLQQPPIRCRECGDILRYAGGLDDPSAAIASPKPANSLHLELRLGRRVIVMDRDRPIVTMGRQRHNDIEVIDTRVSRSHARIEFRDGRFILIDHSTNGTYLKIEGMGKSVTLKQSETLLSGVGAINLGRKNIDRPFRTIYFALKP